MTNPSRRGRGTAKEHDADNNGAPETKRRKTETGATAAGEADPPRAPRVVVVEAVRPRRGPVVVQPGLREIERQLKANPPQLLRRDEPRGKVARPRSLLEDEEQPGEADKGKRRGKDAAEEEPLVLDSDGAANGGTLRRRHTGPTVPVPLPSGATSPAADDPLTRPRRRLLSGPLGVKPESKPHSPVPPEPKPGADGEQGCPHSRTFCFADVQQSLLNPRNWSCQG